MSDPLVALRNGDLQSVSRSFDCVSQASPRYRFAQGDHVRVSDRVASGSLIRGDDMKSPLAHVSVVGDNAVPLSVVGEDVNLSVATRMRNPFGALNTPFLRG